MASVLKSRAMSPSTEVKATATRRRFSGKYKQKILDEVAACIAAGEVGALLRREGLYSSHLTKWRRQAEAGRLGGLEPKKRGPVARVVDPRDERLAELERALSGMTKRAELAEALVEVQKKVSALLGIVLPTPDEKT